jgi:hypothetical protein
MRFAMLTAGRPAPALAALALALACVGAQAQQPAGSQIKEQISIQEGIYRSRGDRPEGYVIDRSLLSYTFTLSPEFRLALASLGPQDRWLDIGAGQGQAVLDYYADRYDAMNPEGRERRGSKAGAVAMSIEDRRTPLWEKTAAGLAPGKIRYLAGRRLREYSPQELGRFQLISDVIGGFSYAVDLSLFMEKTLALLEPNGSLFTVLQDVRAEVGTNAPHYEGSPYLTEIKGADGTEVRVCSWLKSISCVQVTCQLRTEWRPPIEVYQVKKVCEDVSVPALSTVHYQAGTPPERSYTLNRNPRGAAAKPAPLTNP